MSQSPAQTRDLYGRRKTAQEIAEEAIARLRVELDRIFAAHVTPSPPHQG